MYEVILAHVARETNALDASDRLWWAAIYYPLPVELQIELLVHPRRNVSRVRVRLGHRTRSRCIYDHDSDAGCTSVHDVG